MAKNGLVHITTATFTTQASVSIESCFSATYTHYIVKRNLLGSVATAELGVRLRVSGSDDSGTNYRRQYLDGTNTTLGAARATGQTSWGGALGFVEATQFGFAEAWISNPFEAVRTTSWIDGSWVATGNIELWTAVYAHDLTTSYTSLTVFPSSGTITGTITVYGLVKS